MAKKVLIADKFPKAQAEELRKLGLEVEVKLECKDAALAAALRGANVLIVRSTKVTPEVLAGADKLELIVRAGAGYNTIDIQAAGAKGAYVTNCPGTNSLAVAELTMGLIMALDRRLADNVAELRAGKWNKKEYGKADGLAGKTLGILGLGQIGSAVAKRGKAFGMKLIGWDKWSPIPATELGLDECVEDLYALAARADIVTVHVAMSPESKHLINREFLSKMKPRAMLINAARGEIVETDALIEAVKAKGLRVGLDVYEGEPEAAQAELPAKLRELVALPGVYGTHHIGASTDQAQNAVAEMTVQIIREYLASGRAENCVNAKLVRR